MRNCRNALRICKFFEERGELFRPDCDEEFHIKVESCSQKRYYSLNPENCFCVTLEGLGNETFCVSEEECGFDATYTVDGCPVEKACVDFEDCDFHRIGIINHSRVREGDLRIRARVEDSCGNAMCDFGGLRMRICGDEFEQIFTLDEENCFEVCFNDLPFGCYQVEIAECEDFDVAFNFNGCVSNCGEIRIDGCENTLNIIARHNNPIRTVRICRWCQCGDGRLVKPGMRECFALRVRKRNSAFREFTLDCENRFCMTLEGRREDAFEIQQLDDCDVKYEVDGIIVDCVRVCMDEDHDVRIIGPCEQDRHEDCHDECECECIHKEKEECEKPSHGCEEKCSEQEEKKECTHERTSLRISKWVEKKGKMCHPEKEDCFRIRVQGYSDQCFLLNQRNHFTVTLDDIRPGYYCIYEESDNNYDVRFEVDGCSKEDGYLFVNSNQQSDVRIINRRREEECGKENVVRIMKRVDKGNHLCRCTQEQLQMPNSGSFEISVSGMDGCKRYTLEERNCFEVTLPLQQGKYTIRELNPCNRVSYIVDGEKKEEACFMSDGRMHEVIIVNHVSAVNYVI